MTVFSNEEIRRSSGPHTGQTVVVIGGSGGTGRATALEARAQGGQCLLTGRDPNHLRLAAQEVGALSPAAFDATKHERLERFFDDLPQPIDHVLVTAGGSYYALLPDMDLARVRGALEEHLLLTLNVARSAIGTVRPGGTLIFITDDLNARRTELGRTLPIRRVVEPEDVAALAVHIMTNSALTGATFDVDGGEQVLGKG
jgi:NAD(P)-dependent dehydrogenase (short-subunit alcohol dehydrogenase family)